MSKHRRFRAWLAAGVAAVAALGVVAAPAAARTAAVASNVTDGYVMLDAAGQVYAFGEARFCGHATSEGRARDLIILPDNSGYWILMDSAVELVACDAQAATRYEAGHPLVLRAGERAVSLSATKDGTGYWVFTSTGRVLTFGTAPWYGDMSAVALNGPVLDSATTPTGKGYYMVASDGGIFTFGDAKFSGSMGGKRLNQPIIALAPDPDQMGYWLLASDGGVFSFDARFNGSMGSTRLNAPMTGIITSPLSNGGGYMMVAADGGAFLFGTFSWHGSLGSTPPADPVISLAPMH